MFKFSLNFLFVLFIFSFVTSVTPQSKDAAIQISDEQIVDQLTSRNWKNSTEAVHEIIKRGERMIPLLLKLKGRKEIFVGHGLGSPNSASFSAEFDVRKGLKKELIVTVEITALYLISAVYYDNLSFAQNPFLTDLTVPRDKRTYNNGNELVGKAWKTTEMWLEKYHEIGIEKLRLSKDHPLKGADVAFW